MNKFKKRKISAVDMLTAVDTQDSLTSFIFSLEVMLLEIDTLFSKRDIMLACAVKYNSIKKAIDKVKARYKGEKAFELAADTFMNSPEFMVYRKQLAIK